MPANVDHSSHDNVVGTAIQKLVLSARKPWPPATMAIVQDRWYRRGGMTLVMQEYFSFHMNRPDGELRKLGLTPKQMTEVRNLLESSGELEELLEAKIRDSMPDAVKTELEEAKIQDIVADDSRYSAWSTLKTALDGESVALVKGEWLMQYGLGKLGPDKRLPKRQDMGKDTHWNNKDLVESLGNPDKRAIAVVAISYCWRSAAHPDPDG